MNADTTGQRLHDRANRGEPLSSEERAQLKAWYERLDQEEGIALSTAPAPGNNAVLRGQIDHTLAEIATLTLRIQELTAENATLRREVASFLQLLAQKLTPKSA